MKAIHALFAALLMLGFAILPMPASADADAQRFLEAIYQKYIGQDTSGVSLDSNEALLNYFTPELAAMIALDAERSRKSDEPPVLDGDPFIGAQDWDIKDVAVTVKDTGPGKAVGTVIFTNMGDKQSVELELKKIPQGWRIDEIRWSEGSLREILKGGGDDNDSNGNDDRELPEARKL